MKDVYFRCGECGKRILEPDRKAHIFRETDIPLRCIIGKIEKLYGKCLCKKCLGGHEMNADGKNFEGYLTAMGQVSKREQEKLLDKARNDKGVTVAGYLKLENYAMALNSKKNRTEGQE